MGYSNRRLLIPAGWMQDMLDSGCLCLLLLTFLSVCSIRSSNCLDQYISPLLGESSSGPRLLLIHFRTDAPSLLASSPGFQYRGDLLTLDAVTSTVTRICRRKEGERDGVLVTVAPQNPIPFRRPISTALRNDCVR